MSVRAHKVKKIDYDNAESFNLWHDDKIVDYLSCELTGLNQDSCGIIEVAVNKLEKMFEDLKLNKEDYDVLWKNIQDAKEKDENYLMFWCF